jgi:transformer-2 protein
VHLLAQLVAMTALEATHAALRRPTVMVTWTAGQYSPSPRILRPLTARSGPPKNDRGPPQDDGAVNPGSNLFVTGIHPKLSEHEVTRLFEKYGDVEKCQIMLDPHTKESRGFGFVKMVTAEQADAAKEGLQGEVIEGRTLSIEKARRSRPRTPTPGKYFGPPKRG